MDQCELCGRPAGESNLCEEHYRELASAGLGPSPLELLLGGGLFDALPRMLGDVAGGSFSMGGASTWRGRRSAPRQASPSPVDLRSFLDEAAMRSLQAAAEKAVEFGKDEVDTEHLLLALLENDEVQEVLRKARLSPEALRDELEHKSPRGDFRADEDEAPRVGVSPQARSALDHARVASRQQDRSHVAPGHLLMGLLEEDDGLAGDLLRKMGLPSEAPPPRRHGSTPTLDQYARDLTGLARQGKLDPVIGRAAEIETAIEVLARRKKNNPVLIGEPGVGKTAIVEGLAQRIVLDQVPEVLRGKRLVELSVNSLVAGSRYRGEFEERVQALLDEITAAQDELIVFIDEIHTIVGAGQGSEGGLDIANTFKPALARGELHLVGATTLDEYRKHIEKDAALERRFQPVVVPEPGIEDTMAILRGLRGCLEAHHKVRIADEAIAAAATLAGRYIANRFQPDKAIDLIDQAAARAQIQASARRRELQELAPEVGPEHVARIVSSLTGIPVAELTTGERAKLLALEEHLRERVVGQEEAVHAVAEAVRLARAGLAEAGKPTATFLFLGPTGVGKTELAKALAASVFGSEDAIVRIDMSEYAERHNIARLVGAPPGYVGYEEGGQLTERVRRRPYSVVLLDEIEKAHPEVHNVLLQLFDEGRLTDGHGRVVDFTNTVIIATSNIGSDAIRRNLAAGVRKRLDYCKLRDRLMGLLKGHFRPEFLNRLDEVVVFHALGREQIRRIVQLQLRRVAQTALRHDVHLEFAPALVDHLARTGYDPEFGARMLKRRVRSEVEAPLANAMLRGELGRGDRVKLAPGGVLSVSA